MLYLLFAWLVLTVVCTIIGSGLLDMLQLQVITRLGDRWMLTLWLGVLALALTLLSVSLSLPLSPGVGALVAGLLCLVALRRSGTRTFLQELKARCSRKSMGLMLLLLVLLTLPMTQVVSWYDTGLYHFGVIRWLSNYGSVPGLSLLVSQFGFFSTWFAFAAPFNPEFLGTRGTVVVNGFIIGVSLLHLCLSGLRIVQSRARLSDYFLSLFTLMWCGFLVITSFIRVVFISPSTDIPILLLTGVFSWVLVSLFESSSTITSTVTSTIANASDAQGLDAPQPLAAQTTTTQASLLGERMLLLLLGAGAVAIKLTALPILPVAGLGYSFTQGRFHWRRAGIALAMLFLLLVPAMSYSLVTSGCPLYPSQALCMHHLPWSALPEQMATEVSRVTDWMDWFGEPPPGVVHWQWAVKQWLTNTISNVAIIGLAGLALLGIIVFLRLSPIRRIDDRLWILLLGSLGMTFTLTRTLVVRLGLGYFLVLPAFFGALILTSALWRKLTSPMANAIANIINALGSLWRRHSNLLLAVGAAGLTFLLTIQPDFVSRILLPPPLPAIESATAQINNLEYNYPTDSEGCWAIALPCIQEGVTPQKGSVLEDNLMLRDPERGLSAGFMLDKTRSSIAP